MEKPNVGLIINKRYRLVQYLGQGSFGEVWMARDLITNLDVAIKLYLSLDEKGREEFLSEYKVAYGLTHPNLVVTEVYDTWESRPFLIMKFCSKGSSSKVIGNLTPNYGDERFVWKFIHDVSAGLAYLHNQTPDPIVHQDIKPDNILVDSDGSFLISDFGISKRIRSTMRAQSARALKAGATAYMGPERFSKNPAPITASDIWSLGVSIYELVEGELPFAGMGGIFLKNGGEMAELSNGWTVELNDVMQKCLARETWDRMKAFELEELSKKILDKFDVWYAAAPKIGDSASKPNQKQKVYDSAHFVNTDNPFNVPPSGNEKVDEPSIPNDDKDNAGGEKQSEEKKNQEESPVNKNSGVFENEGGESLEKKDGKKRTYIYIAAAVIVALVAGGLWFFLGNNDESKDALIAYESQYLPLVEQCNKHISEGDQAQYDELVMASNELATLDSLENIYSAILPDKFNRAVALRSQYEEKAIPASKAWAESARTQITELDNSKRAIEYYKVAYSIYKDPEIEKELSKLNGSTKTE